MADAARCHAPVRRAAHRDCGASGASVASGATLSAGNSWRAWHRAIYSRGTSASA